MAHTTRANAAPTWYNSHLFCINGQRMKFHLHGFLNREIDRISQLVEAYGGLFADPDDDVVTFSEPNCPIKTHQRLYNVKYIYDSIWLDQVQNLERYALPLVPSAPAKSTGSPNPPQTINNSSANSTDIRENPTIKVKSEPETICINDDDDAGSHDKPENSGDSRKNLWIRFFCAKCNVVSPVGVFLDADSSTRQFNLYQCAPLQKQNHSENLGCARSREFARGIPQSAGSDDQRWMPKWKETKRAKRNLIYAFDNADDSPNLPSGGTAKKSSWTEGSDVFPGGRKFTKNCRCNSSAAEVGKKGGAIMRRYSEVEDRAIMDYVIKNDLVAQSMRMKIWRNMENEEILANPKRTAGGIKARYKVYLLPNYHKYTTNPRVLREFDTFVKKHEIQPSAPKTT